MNQTESPIPSMLIKAGVWLGVVAVLFLLRSFFLLIFLTFVFSYIQRSGELKLQKYLPRRSIRVIFVGICFLGILIGLGSLIAPRVIDQTRLFVMKYPQYIDRLDREIIDISKDYPSLSEMLPEPTQDHGVYSPTAEILQQIVGFHHGKDNEGLVKAISTIREVGTSALGFGSAFLLAILFSFLIIFDFPNLTTSAESLRNTRIKFIYDEVAGSIYDFCLVLGRALEAQLFIALINTALTAVGLHILGITEKTAFLSLIVFLCSFIPVAGVFLSSVPICLVALQQSGLQLMLWAITMITIVHMVEAYILNPKIYGHHLRMNPVIVLIILTISGKLFHVWGLILGVPVCTYIVGHAIRTRDPLVEALPPVSES
jgi:predicted PurR-regulated permease PerM